MRELLPGYPGITPAGPSADEWIFQKLSEHAHGFPLTVAHHVRADVHGHADLTVPEDRLSDLGMHLQEGQQRPAGMPSQPHRDAAHARPYPADRLLETIEAGTVFTLRAEEPTAGTITLTQEAEEGMWSDDELRESSMFINKLTVSRDYSGQDLGGRLLDWAGDRAYRAGAKWLRLDAWTTNERLQRYYLDHGFDYVRTVREGAAVNGGP